MTDVERTLTEIHASFWGEAWHGPAVMEALGGIDAPTAAAYPIPGAHSIWEQVNHLHYAQAILIRRLAGEAAPWDHSADWPVPHDTSPIAWQQRLETFRQTQHEMEDAVARVPESQLHQTAGNGVTFHRMLHGHAQHNAYHAGQIMLLRRALVIRGIGKGA